MENAPTARPVREHEAEFAIAFGHAKRVNGTVRCPALGRAGSLGRVLAGVFFLNLSRCDPHDVDRVANHVGGALLTFGASGHA